MRVIEHDPDRPILDRPRSIGINFTPFRVVQLGHSQEVRLDISDSSTGKALSARFYKSKGRGRPMEAGRPITIFPEHLPALIAVLTEAAAEIGAPSLANENAD